MRDIGNVFEGKNLFCHHCHLHGHSATECPKAQQLLAHENCEDADGDQHNFEEEECNTEGELVSADDIYGEC